MSHKKGLGFNKFTGQRAAGFGFQQQHEEPNTNRSNFRQGK